MYQKHFYTGKTAEEIELSLQREGLHVEIEEDEPGTIYDPHAHDETILAIVEGSMKLLVGDATFHLRKGDRFTVPANAPHSAIVGSKGCVYAAGMR